MTIQTSAIINTNQTWWVRQLCWASEAPRDLVLQTAAGNWSLWGGTPWMPALLWPHLDCTALPHYQPISASWAAAHTHPPPFATDIASCHSLPQSLCCCNQEPSLVWEGVAWGGGSRKLDEYQSHRQQESFREVPSPHTPQEPNMSRMCVLFMCATPQDTRGRWAARQYHRAMDRFQHPWRNECCIPVGALWFQWHLLTPGPFLKAWCWTDNSPLWPASAPAHALQRWNCSLWPLCW